MDGSTDETVTNINVVKDDYKVICLQGQSDYSDHTVIVTLDAALATGDKIKVTGFRSKNVIDPQSGFKAKFDKGGEVASSTGLDYVNINNEDKGSTDSNHGTAPNTCTFTVPAAANGSTTITMTRSHTNTNFWITKIEIVRPNVVYSKALSEWADGDLTEWVGDKADYGTVTRTDESGTHDKVTRTANSTNGLYFESFGYQNKTGQTDYPTTAATACNFTKSVTTNANTLIEWNAVWNPGNATGRANSSRGFIKFGDVEFKFFGQSQYSQAVIGSADAATISGGGTTRMKDYTLSVTINKATNAVDYTFDNVSGSGTTAGTFGSVQYGIAGNMPNWSLDSKIKSISIVETPAPIANYTVKYVDGEGTEIKTSDASRTHYVGADVPALLSTDTENFWVDTKKYIYVSNDLSGKQVAEDGSTVVTVTFREAGDFNYTINAVDGSSNILKEIATGSYTEGESLKYTYPKYVADGGDLYLMTASKTNATVDITEDDQVINVVYSKSAEGTYYFYEFDGGYTTRADYESNGSAITQNATVTVPSTGVYVVTANCYGSASNRSADVKVGETTIVESTTIGIYAPGTDLVSSNVLLEKDAVITVHTSSSKDGIDYVILQKLCDVTDASKVLGAVDYTTDYASVWNSTPVWINAGETGYYKIKNWNNTASANLYENWYIWAANESSQNLVIFGPNHSNTANGTYNSKPTFTMDDLNGATVELYFKLTDAGDGTYTWTTTAVTTKADGTELTPNLVYTQTGINVSRMKAYVSVEKSWLEVLEQKLYAVDVKVTSAGYATYVNSDYDLNFTDTDIKAYKVKVNTKGKATMTQVNNVPAGAPVLLYYEGGKTEDIPVMTGAAAVTENDLVAGTGAAVPTSDGEGNTNMILNNVDSKIGFYFAAGQTVATNRAYLHFASTLAPDAVASRMVMVFADEEATAVFDLNDNSEMINNNWYDLQGRRVDGSRLNSGIYIKNGKKVVVK